MKEFNVSRAMKAARQRRYMQKRRLLNPLKEKEIDKLRHKKYREQEREYARAYYQSRKTDPLFVQNRKDRGNRYYHANRFKARARGLLGKAVRRGELSRPKICFKCDSPCKPEAHHNDHSKPFEVLWLCKRCHENQHHAGIDAALAAISDV